MTLAAFIWLTWTRIATTMTGPDCWERGVNCGVNVCQTHRLDADANGCLDLLDVADWLVSIPPENGP